jgi:hypothetical protein
MDTNDLLQALFRWSFCCRDYLDRHALLLQSHQRARNE